MFDSDWGKSLREGIAVVGCIILVLLLLILYTHSPQDPSFFNSINDSNVTNIGGIFGAYVSGMLLETFGRSAYVFCIVLFLFGRILLFYPKNNYEIASNYLGWVWSAVGAILFVISSSSLEFLRFHNDEGLPAGAGGLVGILFAENMSRLFGPFGASLLFISLLVLSLSLTLGLSWFSFFDIVGTYTEKTLTFLYRCIHSKIRNRTKIELTSLTESDENEINHNEETPIDKTAVYLLKKNKIKKPENKKEEERAPLFEVNPTIHHTENDQNETRPTLDLLDASTIDGTISEEQLHETAALIEKALLSFNVSAKVVSILPGPVVTRYDLQPATGVKGSQIVNLGKDIARSLSISAIRVLETIPGTNYIGLELPNTSRESVQLSDLLASDIFQEEEAALPLGLGKTASGDVAIADLAKMPHLLVAGSTGSGKSVFVNAILLSLLFVRSSDEMRLLLIDPKMLELAMYGNIPHLLAPVVTDMDLAPVALNWAVEEMENRYRKMSGTGVRHIVSYNAAIDAGKIVQGEDDEEPPTKMPYIVIIIDELADLMMVAGKKVEISISRLAQKARAAGIHMILATQRPSVDVITGLIKANVPCRLSFQVASKIDSRTILDQMGAEALLGKGDMLYMPAGAGIPQRLHGAFVSDDEVRRVVDFIRQQTIEFTYLTDFKERAQAESTTDNGGNKETSGESDPLYDQAVEVVLETKRASISLVQRKLRIGYNRAARLIETMEEAGLVSSINEVGARKILPPHQ